MHSPPRSSEPSVVCASPDWLSHRHSLTDEHLTLSTHAHRHTPRSHAMQGSHTSKARWRVCHDVARASSCSLATKSCFSAHSGHDTPRSRRMSRICPTRILLKSVSGVRRTALAHFFPPAYPDCRAACRCCQRLMTAIQIVSQSLHSHGPWGQWRCSVARQGPIKDRQCAQDNTALQVSRPHVCVQSVPERHARTQPWRRCSADSDVPKRTRCAPI